MIGIFDSGSGGISVLRHIRRMAPTADIVYFADTKHMPYGERTPDEITTLTLAGVRQLRDAGADTIVIACNSASSVFQPLTQLLLGGASFIDTIEPTVLSVPANATRPIGIVATPTTIRSKIFQSQFARCGIPTIDLPSATLATAIEHSAFTNIRHIIRSIIQDAVRQHCTTLLLCCTHYPLAYDIFLQEIRRSNNNILLIDPTIAIARSAICRASTEGTGIFKVITTEPSETLHHHLRAVSSPT